MGKEGENTLRRLDIADKSKGLPGNPTPGSTEDVSLLLSAETDLSSEKKKIYIITLDCENIIYYYGNWLLFQKINMRYDKNAKGLGWTILSENIYIKRSQLDRLSK